MSEIAEIGRALKDERRERRARLGIKCPRCAEVRPKCPASILLPGQRCKVDGYRDPRKEGNAA